MCLANDQQRGSTEGGRGRGGGRDGVMDCDACNITLYFDWSTGETHALERESEFILVNQKLARKFPVTCSVIVSSRRELLHFLAL